VFVESGDGRRFRGIRPAGWVQTHMSAPAYSGLRCFRVIFWARSRAART